MQHLRKFDTRIEIISILVLEVSVLGNAPTQRFRLLHNYCESTFSQYQNYISKGHFIVISRRHKLIESMFVADLTKFTQQTERSIFTM